MSTAKQTSRQAPANAARGLLMGGADVIPGVSGGTVALVLGIYERLIVSVSACSSAAVSALRGDIGRARQRAGDVEWSLVIPLAVGIGAALGIGSAVLPPLLERFPVQANALFFGLVAGSLPVPWQRVGSRGPRNALAIVPAAALAFWLVGLPPGTVHDPAAPLVFGAAALAISAMVLPGISGAFLLKAMGLYELSLSALRHLDVGYLAAFVPGAAVGLAVFARLLSWLLTRAHDVTMAVLVGLMAGALRALWPWQGADRELLGPTGTAGDTLVVAALALGGFLTVFALTHWGERTPVRGAASEPR